MTPGRIVYPSSRVGGGSRPVLSAPGPSYGIEFLKLHAEVLVSLGSNVFVVYNDFSHTFVTSWYGHAWENQDG